MNSKAAGIAACLLALATAATPFGAETALAAQKTKGQQALLRQESGRVAVGTELTESECTRLGGTVTSDGNPQLPGCSTGLRCKTVGSNGDIHSICIDEAK